MDQVVSNATSPGAAQAAGISESSEAMRTPHVRFVDKLRIVAGCVVAVWLLRVLGWIVIHPVDPEMGLTFVLNGHSMMGIWFVVLLLSVVSSVLGTAISGRRLPEAGMLVGCVGLAALAARGGTMQDVLAYHAGIVEATRQKLMLQMMGDTALWAVILLVNWLAVTAAYRWLYKAPFHFQLTSEPSPGGEAKRPKVSGQAKYGWLATGATTIAALFVMNTAFGRTAVTPILRGQIFGTLFLGFMVIVIGVRYFVGIHDSRWYAVAPLLVALAAYTLGYFNADMSWAEPPYRELATTPPHMLARALPVEYLAVGLAGTIMGFWSGEKIEEVAELEQA